MKGCVWCFISVVYNVTISIYQLENSPRRGKIIIILIQSNFQLSVKSNLTLHWFCLTSLRDWSRNLAPLCQPIRSKTKTNHDLFTHVFPRFKKFAFFQLNWLFKAFFFLLIGHSGYFGFGFTAHKKHKRLPNITNIFTWTTKVSHFVPQYPWKNLCS